MYDSFVCGVCGFTSEEEIGQIYYCPKCGNQMQISRSPDYLGNGGDPNPSRSILAFDLMYLIFVGGLSFGIMNYMTYWTPTVVDFLLFVIWLLLFILSWVLVHKYLTNKFRGKAKRR